jgi:hypothetical protein
MVRLTPFSVAGSTFARDLREAESNHLTNCWANCLTINPVVLELIVRHGQCTIAGSTVVTELYLDAIQNASA